MDPHVEPNGRPDLVAEFTERLEEVGGKVHRAADQEAARRILREICAAVGAEAAIGRSLIQEGRQWTFDDYQGARVAVSDAAFGIAETGTVCLLIDSADAALAPRLPFLHVVVLAAADLIPRLEEAVPQMRAALAAGRSYIDWVTGPSRSADIEQSLTIGIHGPFELHCILI